MGSTWASRLAPLGLPKQDRARSVHPLHIGPKWVAFVLLNKLPKQNSAGFVHLYYILTKVTYSPKVVLHGLPSAHLLHTEPNGLPPAQNELPMWVQKLARNMNLVGALDPREVYLYSSINLESLSATSVFVADL